LNLYALTALKKTDHKEEETYFKTTQHKLLYVIIRYYFS